MEYARGIFDKLPKRNVVTWTALMTGYVQNSQPELAIQVFQELLESGTYPTNYTLGAILNACSSLFSIELGKQIHGYIIKYQIESDTSMGNALCSLYSKCGSFEFAVKAFRRIPEKNVISWTTVLSACGDNGQAETGLRFFAEMLSEDAKPNEFTLTSVLSLCCIIHALGFGEQVHSFSIKLGFESNLSIRNSIMYLYLRSGRVDEARRLFDAMETITLVTWNAMIAGYSQMVGCAKDDLIAHHSGIEALNIFLKLKRSSMKPDLFTFSSILTVCSGLVALDQGEQIHAQTIKSGFLSDVVVGSALVNMYNKCGSIEKATKAFVEMPTRTLISWTSMITGYAQHGRSLQALQLFEDMRLAGVRPNKITFVGVLSACSHAGMVDEALSYFEMMKKKYKIKPVMDHFACLIDMFVRLGKLQEAFDFVKKMDFEPNECIWSILIAGCRSHGNMELAFYAAERLLELKPKDGETYALLLSMYLSAGKWKDVSNVRKLMRDDRLGKLRDWSSVSIKNKVYSFKPDDKSHSQSADMYKLLEDLVEKAQSLGYVSQKSLEMTDEEDKGETFSSTVHHSEKLGVAFGLLNMCRGASIRVIKSISMCRDCHSLIKYISLLTGREIIIRDSKRLHQFNDGHCTCGDFGSLL
ncbi:Pentatricopeptide repeat [Macleaya cordata]|uniref:Pentatricopeptide repeat n=1 Tax=Macleaya cordata TaxID=56857 RepID=A0A200QXT4_MACCD|nr:Pentatricopeptide repeat [Macleaya cordata]